MGKIINRSRDDGRSAAGPLFRAWFRRTPYNETLPTNEVGSVFKVNETIVYPVKVRSGEAWDHECAENVPSYVHFLDETKFSLGQCTSPIFLYLSVVIINQQIVPRQTQQNPILLTNDSYMPVQYSLLSWAFSREKIEASV